MTAPSRPIVRAGTRRGPSAPLARREQPAAFPLVTVDESPAQSRWGRLWDLLVDLALGFGMASLIVVAGLIVALLGVLWLLHQTGAW